MVTRFLLFGKYFKLYYSYKSEDLQHSVHDAPEAPQTIVSGLGAEAIGLTHQKLSEERLN